MGLDLFIRYIIHYFAAERLRSRRVLLAVCGEKPTGGLNVAFFVVFCYNEGTVRA